jgi:hypothetical protein
MLRAMNVVLKMEQKSFGIGSGTTRAVGLVLPSRFKVCK